MLFDWDAANVRHIARHGVTPGECEEAYRNGPMVIEHQRRKHERRRLCLGQTNKGRLLTFVVIERMGKSGSSPRTRWMLCNGESIEQRMKMASKHQMPRFKSEQEEAAWWDAHPEVITELFLKAR